MRNLENNQIKYTLHVLKTAMNYDRDHNRCH